MTGHIEKVIARLPEMKPRDMNDYREKAQQALAKNSDHPEARRLLAAIDDFLAHKVPATNFIQTGSISWEPHSSTESEYRGFVNGEQVARILKSDTHTQTRKDVYSVEVLGERLPKRFQYIDKAREEGWAVFQLRDVKQNR